MQVTCPTCGGAIVPDDVNVAKDVAFCRTCNEAFSLSGLVSDGTGPDAPQVDPSRPPRGVTVEELPNSFTITATTRHPIAFFLVPFMCVWSGGSLGGFYGSQIASGEFSLLPSLIGLPFLGGTILFGSIALMSVCGKVRIRVEGDQGDIFTGVGCVGRRKRFDWSQVSTVSEQWGNVRHPTNHGGAYIALDGQQRVKFGVMLNDERRYFVVNVLKQFLVSRI